MLWRFKKHNTQDTHEPVVAKHMIRRKNKLQLKSSVKNLAFSGCSRSGSLIQMQAFLQDYMEFPRDKCRMMQFQDESWAESLNCLQRGLTPLCTEAYGTTLVHCTHIQSSLELIQLLNLPEMQCCDLS